MDKKDLVVGIGIVLVVAIGAWPAASMLGLGLLGSGMGLGFFFGLFATVTFLIMMVFSVLTITAVVASLIYTVVYEIRHGKPIDC